MLHRFVETIRHAGARTGFDAYYSNLRGGSLPGAPTRDEAWIDYQAYRAATKRSHLVW